MPDLTLTFTTDQVARIKTAFGVTTAPEMVARIKAWVKATVVADARARGQQAAIDTAEAELDAGGWNE